MTGEWPYHLPGNPLRWVLGANPHLPTLQDNSQNSSAAMLVSTVPSDLNEKHVFDTLVPGNLHLLTVIVPGWAT